MRPCLLPFPKSIMTCSSASGALTSDYNVVMLDAGKPVYGTDADGSPLQNTPGTNSADRAWEDLWFYSNPIFVEVH